MLLADTLPLGDSEEDSEAETEPRTDGSGVPLRVTNGVVERVCEIVLVADGVAEPDDRTDCVASAVRDTTERRDGDAALVRVPPTRDSVTVADKLTLDVGDVSADADIMDCVGDALPQKLADADSDALPLIVVVGDATTETVKNIVPAETSALGVIADDARALPVIIIEAE